MRDWFQDDDHSPEAIAWRATQQRYHEEADARKKLHEPYTEQYIWDEFDRYLERLYAREQGQFFLVKAPHRTYIRFRRGRVIGGWWNASVMVQGWEWFPPGREHLKHLQGKVQQLWFNPTTGHWRSSH